MTHQPTTPTHAVLILQQHHGQKSSPVTDNVAVSETATLLSLRQQRVGHRTRFLTMVLLYYQDSVCWCVLMMGHSYKDEVERQVQDELNQKTTGNDECLPEVD